MNCPIKRGNLPIKILLLDNQRLRGRDSGNRSFFMVAIATLVLDDNPDFVTLASAFGIAGERIERQEVSDALMIIKC